MSVSRPPVLLTMRSDYVSSSFTRPRLLRRNLLTSNPGFSREAYTSAVASPYLPPIADRRGSQAHVVPLKDSAPASVTSRENDGDDHRRHRRITVEGEGDEEEEVCNEFNQDCDDEDNEDEDEDEHPCTIQGLVFHACLLGFDSGFVRSRPKLPANIKQDK